MSVLRVSCGVHCCSASHWCQTSRNAHGNALTYSLPESLTKGCGKSKELRVELSYLQPFPGLAKASSFLLPIIEALQNAELQSSRPVRKASPNSAHLSAAVKRGHAFHGRTWFVDYQGLLLLTIVVKTMAEASSNLGPPNLIQLVTLWTAWDQTYQGYSYLYCPTSAHTLSEWQLRLILDLSLGCDRDKDQRMFPSSWMERSVSEKYQEVL